MHAQCPECSIHIPLDDFVADGFLRTRAAKAGGPYYELDCPGQDCEVVLLLERESDGERVVSVRGSGLIGRSGSSRQRFPAESRKDHRGAETSGADTSGAGASSGHQSGASDRGGDARDERDAGEERTRRRRARVPSPDDEPSIAECRTLLGVEPMADRDAVQAAFREKSKRMHPDRFVEFDADFQRLAHEKFIRLKQARDRLMQEINRRA